MREFHWAALTVATFFLVVLCFAGVVARDYFRPDPLATTLTRMNDLSSAAPRIRPGMTRRDVCATGIGGPDDTKYDFTEGSSFYEVMVYQRAGHKLLVFLDRQGTVVASHLD